MIRLGLFGGTFAPFHNGHLQALTVFMQKADPDRVIVMPTGNPPHKKKTELFSDEDRLIMTRQACADLPHCTVSDWEIRQHGRCYTSRTTAYLHNRCPGAQLILYLGSDMFLSFHRWHRPQAILDRAELFVLSRTGDDLDALRRQEALLKERFKGVKCTVCPAEPFVITSTQIREIWRQGGDPKPFVPPAVNDYLIRLRKERQT